MTAQALSMVGSEMPERREAADPALVRRWARAVCVGDREWRLGEAVPTTMFMCLAKGMMGPRTAESGFAADEDQLYWIPPLRSKRTFNGGDVIIIHQQLRVGEEVTRRSRLLNVEERRARNGRLRAFVTSETSFQVGKRIRIVWRNYAITVPEDEELTGPTARATVVTSSPDPSSPVPVSIHVDEVRIARFGAINEELSLQHIDKDFARDHLRLPATNVMGWLKLGIIATMLDNWAGFGRVSRLETRYLGIDLVGDTLTATAAGVPSGIEVRVTNQHGITNTTGRAELRD